jgi:CRISPR system Cascade subunit CasE
MFLSSLLINIGANPDRPRPGRLWLRNLYHVHQRLCMAFPSDPRKRRDPDFLAPYVPSDFPEQRNLADKKKTEVDKNALAQVHSARSPEAGFLFRIDPQPSGRAVILVQSAAEPDWNYAFHNAGYLLAAPPQTKPFSPQFNKGERFRFRLVANPTRRLSKHSRERDGKPVEEKWIGKRVPVPTEYLFEWLARQADAAGFTVSKESTDIQPGYIYVNKIASGRGNRLRSVRYEGVLEVTDSEKFCGALLHGIGPGKAFGFGLLSVALTL